MVGGAGDLRSAEGCIVIPELKTDVKVVVSAIIGCCCCGACCGVCSAVTAFTTTLGAAAAVITAGVGAVSGVALESEASQSEADLEDKKTFLFSSSPLLCVVTSAAHGDGDGANTRSLGSTATLSAVMSAVVVVVVVVNDSAIMLLSGDSATASVFVVINESSSALSPFFSSFVLCSGGCVSTSSTFFDAFSAGSLSFESNSDVAASGCCDSIRTGGGNSTGESLSSSTVLLLSSGSRQVPLFLSSAVVGAVEVSSGNRGLSKQFKGRTVGEERSDVATRSNIFSS